MKYIFVTGAPGSKWSSVVKNIYYSPDIDRSDSNPKRTYRDELHLGAYWDPGMEFGQFFHRLNEYDHYQCETEFDAPFTGSGIKIIKSHYFARHIDYIKNTWPDSPIVLAQTMLAWDGGSSVVDLILHIPTMHTTRALITWL